MEGGDGVAVSIPGFFVFVGLVGFGFLASAQGCREGLGGGFVFFVVVGDGDEGLWAYGGLGSGDSFHEVLALGDEVVVFEEVGEDDISHAKSAGGGRRASK